MALTVAIGLGGMRGNVKDILEYIYQRRSIRNFSETIVEKDLLVLLLKAAMAAPSACNSKPWEFIVVTDSTIMRRLRSGQIFSRYNAPTAIVVCGNMEFTLDGPASDFWIQDCSAAIQNILLTAAGYGLGTVWIGIYPITEKILHIKEVLALPDGIIPLGVVYIGYPAENPEPRTQYDENKISWQTYGMKSTWKWVEEHKGCKNTMLWNWVMKGSSVFSKSYCLICFRPK